MKVGIAISKIKTALFSTTVTEEERQELLKKLEEAGGNTFQLDVTQLPASVIDSLLLEKLSDAQRRVLTLFKYGANKDPDKILDAVVGTPAEFVGSITALTTGREPQAELFLNDRWYPVILKTRIGEGWTGDKIGIIYAEYKIAEVNHCTSLMITNNDFTNDEGGKEIFSVKDMLLELGLRPLQSDLREHFELLRIAARWQERTGATTWAIGNAIVFEERSWWRGIDSIPIGSEEIPGQVVIEGEMELDTQSAYRRSKDTAEEWMLPFVRVFSLERKQYVYVDVRDMKEREWQTNAMDQLILPSSIAKILRKIFDVPVANLFGDVIAGKAGGMIILAEGSTGVGKTLTAEVFSEHTQRPLYVLEMAELGTCLQSVEDNLRKIFRRATRWNAVLLFDEADVFLAKRDDNLERSAIVGVFLRLMDYYRGLLFLTTNRADVIDPAFKSRITLALKYPDLDVARRRKIWGNTLKAAKVSLVNELGVLADLDGIPDLDLNGRQIRNLVRLVKALYGDKVTVEQLKEVAEFSIK